MRQKCVRSEKKRKKERKWGCRFLIVFFFLFIFCFVFFFGSYAYSCKFFLQIQFTGESKRMAPKQRHLEKITDELRQNQPVQDVQYYLDRIQLTNFVYSGQLTGPVNVVDLSNRQFGVRFEPPVFSAVTMVTAEPRTTSTIYPKGRFTSMGSQDSIDGLIACYTHVYQLNKMAPAYNLYYIRIGNVVATFYTFPLDLELLRKEWKHCVPEKSLFTGVYFNCRNFGLDTNIMVAFFISGKMNFMGGETIAEVNATFRVLFPAVIVKIKKHYAGDAARNVPSPPPAPNPASTTADLMRARARKTSANFDYSKLVISTSALAAAALEDEDSMQSSEHTESNKRRKTDEGHALSLQESFRSVIQSILEKTENKL